MISNNSKLKISHNSYKQGFLTRRYEFAFTLSEVLITLLIIGVVSALTIPTLISNYQKQEYVTRLKKAYSQFNQVLTQIANDKGCAGDLACSGVFAAGTTNQTLGDEIVKYFSVTKNCGIVPSKGCLGTNLNNYYDSSQASYAVYDDTSANYKFINADGMSFLVCNFALYYGTPDCSKTGWSNSGSGQMSKVCGYIYVDVNGPVKKPNAFGRDLFGFWITNAKGGMLYPMGGKDDKDWGINNWWNVQGCSPTNPIGTICAGRIMEESWQMNY